MIQESLTTPELSVDSKAVKGRVTVQLHDATSGELLYEKKRDNYIADRYWTGVSKMLPFFQTRFNNPASNNSSQNFGDLDSNDAYFDIVPFGGVVLTDYAGAINPEERLIGGECVGGSARLETNTRSLAGTFNASESSATDSFVRLVFDFTTSQGNGIIQSIYTGRVYGPTQPASKPTAAFPSIHNVAYTSNTHNQRMLSPSKKYFLVCAASNNNSNTNCFYNDAKEFLKSGQAGINATWVGSMYISGITSTDTHVYWISRLRDSSSSTTSRNMKVYRATWTNLEAAMDLGGSLAAVPYETVFTLDHAWLNAVGHTDMSSSTHSNWAGLSIDPVSGNLILGNCGSAAGSAPGAYYELNISTGAVVRAYTGAISGSNGGMLTFDPANPNLATGGMFTHTFNRVTNTVKRGPQIANIYNAHLEIAQSSLTPIGSDLYVGQFYTGNGSTSTHMGPWQQFFSRALLDEPVEKTNTNTMKVIYEFTITDPDIFA